MLPETRQYSVDEMRAKNEKIYLTPDVDITDEAIVQDIQSNIQVSLQTNVQNLNVVLETQDGCSPSQTVCKLVNTSSKKHPTIAALHQARLYHYDLAGAKGLSYSLEEHLFKKTETDFRGIGILSLLLKCREAVNGVFSRDFERLVSNIGFLLQNGYEVSGYIAQKQLSEATPDFKEMVLDHVERREESIPVTCCLTKNCENPLDQPKINEITYN